MKVLILGSSGLLGNKIYFFLKKKGLDIIHNGLKKRKLDITNLNNLKIILNKKPDLIINCAAVTSIEKCEKFFFETSKINIKLGNNIFFLKKKLNLKFSVIFLSTDQVYESNKYSKENSKLTTYNNYSFQKLKAEKIYTKNKGIIFRTNFFGKGFGSNKSFSDWLYESFKSNKKFFLFQDIVFNPVRIDTLSNIIYNIIKKKKLNNNGIYNIGSKGKISKSNFGIFFAKRLKIYNNKEIICNSSEILKVRRPKNMSMNIKKFEKKFNIKLPNIKSEIINEIKNYK
jgi:dTDP-4-dehydrorhamnose reductase